MPELPAALARLPTFEVVEEVLETAATRTFQSPDGSRSDAPVYLIRGADRLFLAAATDADQTIIETADPSEVAVKTSLTRDRVQLGPYSVPLAFRTRDRAEAIVAAFKTRPTGPAYRAPPAPQTGARLEEALGVEPWFFGEDMEDPWLLGLRTDAKTPFFGLDGKTHDTPLFVAVSEHRVALMAQAESFHLFRFLEGEAEQIEKFGKDDLSIDGYRLSLGDRAARLATRVINAEPGARLATLFDHAVRRKETRAAIAYAARAWARGHGSSVAPTLSRLAYACGEPDLALAFLAPPGVRLDETGIDVVEVGDARDAYAELFQKLDPPRVQPVRDFPWPPERPCEVRAAGAAHQQKLEMALLQLETLPEPRRTHARLALEADAGETNLAEGWKKTARAYAEEGNRQHARTLIARALEETPEPEAHLLAAKWAFVEGDVAAARASMASALKCGAAPSDLEAVDASAAALETFAEVAAAEGALASAALLLRKREDLIPSTPEEVEALARRCATELGAPRDAALLLEGVARRVELDEGDSAMFWVEAAERRVQAAEAEIAVADLRAAIAAEFLRPEVYRRALNVPGLQLPSPLEGWWRHLHGVLTPGAVAGAPLPPVERLQSADLDELHPGGVGWLDQLRHVVNEEAPPPRETLTRGLERMTAKSYPQVMDSVRDVATRLGIDAPDCYLYRGDHAYGICAWPLQSPLLLIGWDHLAEGERRLSEPALRFALAVEMTHLAAKHPLLAFEQDALGTSRSVYQAFGKYAGTAETVVDLVTMIPGVDQAAKLQRLVRISRRVFSTKSAVDKISGLAAPVVALLKREEARGGIGRETLEGATLQFRLQADRAALMVTGDLWAAVEATLKSSQNGPSTLQMVSEAGLARAIAAESLLPPTEAVRLSELIGFASRSMPAA